MEEQAKKEYTYEDIKKLENRFSWTIYWRNSTKNRKGN